MYLLLASEDFAVSSDYLKNPKNLDERMYIEAEKIVKSHLGSYVHFKKTGQERQLTQEEVFAICPEFLKHYGQCGSRFPETGQYPIDRLRRVRDLFYGLHVKNPDSKFLVSMLKSFTTDIKAKQSDDAYNNELLKTMTELNEKMKYPMPSVDNKRTPSVSHKGRMLLDHAYAGSHIPIRPNKDDQLNKVE